MKDKLKNTLEHEVELLGRSISVLALAGLLLIGGGSAALLTSFGTVSGEADVTQAVLVNGENDKTEYTSGVTSESQVAGTYFTSDLTETDDNKTMTIASQTESSVTVGLDTDYAEGDVSDPSEDALDGVTAHNIVYNPPTESEYDVVVSDSDELEEALTNSSSKILVEPNTYTLSGGKDLGLGASDTELVSAEGPEETTIHLDEVTIEAGPGDSFTVKGFEFTGSGNGQHGDGFIFRSTANSGLEGTLKVEDNIFEASTSASDQREFRYVSVMDVKTLNVEDNFFTGNSDAGIEINAAEGGSTDYTIESNTFAGLVDKGVALRVEDSGSLEIRNNNFVSNSNAAIEVDSVSTHADITTEENYFNHTGDKVEENDFSPSYTLNEADNPQTDGEVKVSAGETVEVTQLTYLDIALGGDDSYSLETSVNPVR